MNHFWSLTCLCDMWRRRRRSVFNHMLISDLFFCSFLQFWQDVTWEWRSYTHNATMCVWLHVCCAERVHSVRVLLICSCPSYQSSCFSYLRQHSLPLLLFTFLISPPVLLPHHLLLPAPLLCKPLLTIFTLSIATPCFPPLCHSSVSQCVHASVALQANMVCVLVAPCNGTQLTRDRSVVPWAINAEPKCSLLFVFKVSILNKHVSCK